MAAESQLMTTSEFASETGIASAKVSKMIRDGKIKAEKISGKWMISPSELNVARNLSKNTKPVPKKKTSKAGSKTAVPAKKPAPPIKARTVKEKRPAAKAIPLTEFVNLTYLTAFGVKEWLKAGRLTGRQNESGEWLIDAANLEVSDIKRLVR